MTPPDASAVFEDIVQLFAANTDVSSVYTAPPKDAEFATIEQPMMVAVDSCIIASAPPEISAEFEWNMQLIAMNRPRV